MFCRHCGVELPEGSNFCPSCGLNQVIEGTPSTHKSKENITPWIMTAAVIVAAIIVAVAFIPLAGDENGDDIVQVVEIDNIRTRYGEGDVHFDVFFSVLEDIYLEDLSIEIVLKSDNVQIGVASRPLEASGPVGWGYRGMFEDVKIKHYDESKDSLGADITIFHKGVEMDAAGYINLPF